MLSRIKRAALLLAAGGIPAAFAWRGPRAALSLTIGAALAIFNFFILERVTARLLVPRTGARFSDYAVPGGALGFVLLLLAVILKWKGFDLVPGMAGLSVIVLAIGAEGVRGFWRG